MPFDPLPIVIAVKIVKEIGTIGSSPLLVLDRNGNEYYAKTTTLNLPRIELINEVFCAYSLSCWGLNTPSVSLIKIPRQVFEQYNSENSIPISSRYSQVHFDETLFFGSHTIQSAIELQDFLPSISKKQFIKLNRPEDLIKIGVFDLWVGNKDRKPENPNFLMTPIEDKIGFYAIDHTAAFAHITNYQEVRDIMLRIDRNYSILATGLAHSIIQYLPTQIVNNLQEDILNGMAKVQEEFDNIVGLVPQEWGFSKNAKAHLKKFFNDTERNSRIANSFIY